MAIKAAARQFNKRKIENPQNMPDNPQELLKKRSIEKQNIIGLTSVTIFLSATRLKAGDKINVS
jgi:hypothetical protein